MVAVPMIAAALPRLDVRRFIGIPVVRPQPSSTASSAGACRGLAGMRLLPPSSLGPLPGVSNRLRSRIERRLIALRSRSISLFFDPIAVLPVPLRPARLATFPTVSPFCSDAHAQQPHHPLPRARTACQSGSPAAHCLRPSPRPPRITSSQDGTYNAIAVSGPSGTRFALSSAGASCAM